MTISGFPARQSALLGCVLTALLLIGLGWASQERSAAQGAEGGDTTIRVSIGSDGAQANGDSGQASVSDDGRYVAFASQASNLVVSDTNGVQDIFVHDRQTGQTSRVSRSSGGDQADGASSQPVISADGRFVAFVSAATNLVADDTNAAADVFVYDRMWGETVRVSLTEEGGQGEQFGHAANPAISRNGRFVVFDSDADLTDGDSSAWRDVFVRDRDVSGEGVFDQAWDVRTVRVSVASDGSEANWHSQVADISDDGRFVVFESGAPSLAPDKSGYTADIFLHDRDADEDGIFDEKEAISTTRISLAHDGSEANGPSSRPAISGDGRFAVFVSRATNLRNPSTPPGRSHIYVYTRQTGQTALLSQAANAEPAKGSSSWPAISRDGRFVGFESAADDLVSHDTNYAADIFLRDRDTDRDGVFDEADAWSISRVSVSSAGAQGVSSSYGPVSLASNGRFLVFTSSAANLVAGDSNEEYDVFVRIRTLGHPQVALPDYMDKIEPDFLYTIRVVDNDYDPDGDEFEVTAVGPALHGDTSLGEPGVVNYRAHALYATSAMSTNTSDTFTYTISDGVYSDTASVNLSYSDQECWPRNLSLLPPDSNAAAQGGAIGDALLDLNLLYRLRDEVLATTPEGQRYTQLHYTYSVHVGYHLLAEPGLKEEALAVLDLWQPALQALVDGQGADVTLTLSQTQALHGFLERLTVLDGGALSQTIGAELARLGPLDDYAGTDIETARGALVGYAVYLPWMANAPDREAIFDGQ